MSSREPTDDQRRADHERVGRIEAEQEIARLQRRLRDAGVVLVEASLEAVAVERERQDAKWGRQNHPDLDPQIGRMELSPVRAAAFLGIPNATAAKAECERDAKHGTTSWAPILIEEVAEAIEAAVMRDPEALTRELVQVAAVCVAWAEAIARREAAAKR